MSSTGAIAAWESSFQEQRAKEEEAAAALLKDALAKAQAALKDRPNCKAGASGGKPLSWSLLGGGGTGRPYPAGSLGLASVMLLNGVYCFDCPAAGRDPGAPW